MKSWAAAARAAASMRSWVAPLVPKAMLAETVSAKIAGSWLTTEKMRRRSGWVIAPAPVPSTRISPDWGS